MAGLIKHLCALICLLPSHAPCSDADLEADADGLREEAMVLFEHGDPRSALSVGQRAVRLARYLPETSWRIVEIYDDAGLYYYSAGQWKQSAHHQAIAVLLACATQENAEMYRTYLERLGLAFAKYRPRQDFGPIAENPLILLKDVALGLRKNPDLRRRYFTTYRIRGASPSDPPAYLYKLRSGEIPESCG